MNPETLELGIRTTVVGLGVVFVVLVLLWQVIGWLDKIIDAQKKAPAGAALPAPAAAAPAAVAAPAAKAAVKAGLSAATVAAIMGAVSAASGTSLANLKFTAIQRGGLHLTWSDAGVQEIINTRQQFL
ncbi:MAG: OadG family protein [Candidatus Accumulibacter sp.]|jgi:sodium pump decarboxylase gamma subunit|nr:OadG family protein [Accumulibacter sp.]